MRTDTGIHLARLMGTNLIHDGKHGRAYTSKKVSHEQQQKVTSDVVGSDLGLCEHCTVLE